MIGRLRLYAFETKIISLYAQQAIFVLADKFYVHVLSLSSRKPFETKRHVSLKLSSVTLSNFIR